jgi:hypothetical protein
MPTNTESLNRELFRLLSKYKPKPLDAEGKSTPIPDEADIFKFEFTKDGEDYGTVYVTLDEDRVLTVYFGDDVADSPDEKTPKLDYDDTWTGLLHQLSAWRMTKGLKGFDTQNKDRVGDDMARRNHMRNKDKIAEGYYATGKKSSYSDAVPSVKIVIEHSRVIEEGEQRYRNINRIFLENQAGERYLLDTKKPGIARVYARHIAEGGKVNDDRWSHIGSLCEEYQKMAGFVRATRNGQFNESAQSLVNEGIAHYASLRESLSRMTGKRGYNAYFESWTPSLMEDGTEENNLNELFVQETLDPRIESVMPILNRIHKKVSESAVDKEMNKLAEWADSLTEDESLTSNNPVGIPEGKGDFGKAIGNLHGWYEVDPDQPNTRQYDFDDQEDGYYADGVVVQDLKTGKIKVEFNDKAGEYGGNNINDTFNSIGDAMNALGTITTQKRYNSGKKPNYDTLALKTPVGPDDVYKTDRAGKIGTLNKGRMGNMKASTQYTMRGGPKGVLPEEEIDESALQAYLGDKKYGEKGMDAGREHASKTKMQNIRAKFSNKEENVTEYGPSATAALQQGQHPIQVAAADRKDQENTLNVNRAAMKAQQDVAKGLDPTQTAAGQTAAGNGVAEGTGSSIERILAAHPEAVENFKQGGDLDYDLESDLWEYYFNNGEIRNYDADASEFISQRLADELGLSEGLDANQKRVGQLGPTEKVKNNNIGKLVGANENFINTVDQAVVSEEDEMAESILSAIKKVGKKVLDKVAPGDEELLKQLDKDAHGGKLPNRYNSDAESAKKYPADSWKVKVDESSDELARILTIMNHRR